MVTVMVPHSKWFSVPQLQEMKLAGRVIDEDEEYYLMNFSRDAFNRKLVGDYSRRKVAKVMCVEYD